MTAPHNPLRILFVCTGNICRSPTADGVLRHMVKAANLTHRIEVDSAATHAYHTGHPPDPRTIQAALQRGYDLSTLRARPVTMEDFELFDFIYAMDSGHLAHLKRLKPEKAKAKIALFLDQDVPDPYYGEARDFMEVLEMVERGCETLIESIRKTT